MNPDKWKRTSSKQIADCRVFKVREDISERESDGKKSSFFVVESPDWVNVIAVTTDEQIVLIEQFRHGIGEMVLEIPGGMVDEGEEAAVAGKRELLEETGYSSQNWVLLGTTRPNPAIQDNTIHHFLALDCEKTAETEFDENESITLRLASIREMNELIKSGNFSHSLAVTAFYYFNARQSEAAA